MEPSFRLKVKRCRTTKLDIDVNRIIRREIGEAYVG